MKRTSRSSRPARPAAPARILVVGAHPDDPECMAGGCAALWTAAGHVVKFLTMTNGDAGHHEMGGGPLALRRRTEALAAARVLKIEYEISDCHDGELMPTLENRRELIRRIRAFHPDLVLTHPPDDYHPDHRYTSLLVQDSAMSVTVPNICPLTPALRANPIFGYILGTRGVSRAFRPDVLVDIGSVLTQKLAMIECHKSQFLEWIPYLEGAMDQVPERPAARRAFVAKHRKAVMRECADRFRADLIALHGAMRGAKIAYVEAIEICPFGSSLDEAARRRLFPFEGEHHSVRGGSPANAN